MLCEPDWNSASGSLAKSLGLDRKGKRDLDLSSKCIQKIHKNIEVEIIKNKLTNKAART
jgi:hypothetical protein